MAPLMHTDFEKVYDEYADMLYRIALSHSGNSHDAMDAVQDVFIKLTSNNVAFKDDEHKKAWLIRATVNRCIDFKRKWQIRSYTPIEEAYDIPDEKNTLPSAVKAMLECLPQRFKTVLILHYLEGFSVDETAKILNLSVSAVKMSLSRARDYVKEKYKLEDFYVE